MAKPFWQLALRTLPPVAYCNLRKFGLIWSDARRRGTRVRFKARNGLLIARYENGDFHFYAAERVRRYVWPQGIEKKKRDMLDKYRVEEVIEANGDTRVAIDIGANVGELTLALADRFDQVIAVEPDPAAYRCLAENVARLSNVRTVQAAIAAAGGSKDFYLSSIGADSSLHPPDRWTNTIRVRCITVAELLAETGIEQVTLLKVEAEGAEPEVLDGAKTALPRVLSLVVDCSPERDGKDTVAQCRKRLLDAEFKISQSQYVLAAFR